MAALVDIVLPDTAYLEEVFQIMVQGKITEEEYTTAIVSGVAELVAKKPETYALYGPFWPSIKELIIASGDLTFGQVIDDDVAQVCRRERPALTMVAALLYSTNRSETHSVSDKYHYLDVQPGADDTEPYLYVSYDESMEKFGLKG